MKSKYLFPAWSGLVGCLLAIPGFVLGYLSITNEYEIPGFGFRMRERDSMFQKAFENLTNELAVFLVVVGLLLIAFSKNKREDELNAKLRLNSLYWSTIAYYLFLSVNLIWVNIFGEIPFVGSHLFEITIFLPLVIFIARYGYLKMLSQESYLIDHPKFLPHQPYKIIGVVLSILGLGTLIYTTFFQNSWSDLEGYAYLVAIIGLSSWAFSKHRVEDEMTMQFRLESLLLAVYLNYGILLVSTLFIYSLAYLYVLCFSTLSLLLFFIARMEYINYSNNKLIPIEGDLSHEK